MDLALSPELEAFRREIRAGIREILPPGIARRQAEGWHPTAEDTREWMYLLSQKGWSLPEWPIEFGGAGWSPLQGYIFEDESAQADAPQIGWHAGVNLVGPVICNFGTDAQKEYYLPKIRNGDHLWCQGFSEPNAGSDLASVRTTAVRDGDRFIVNGQKIWTSEAHFADQMFALVCTDSRVKPQLGLSCLIIDMKSPGLIVRPIQSIDNAHHLNEVFFDDVAVPIANLVGEMNAGWTYAKFLLGHERHLNAMVQRNKREIRKLRHLASSVEYGHRFIDDPTFRRTLTELEIDLSALEWAVYRSACAQGAMGSRDMAFASSIKIEGSLLLKRTADLQIEILGPWVAPDIIEPESGPWEGRCPGEAPGDVPGIMTRAIFRRAATIYGGSSEVQHNIIWNSVFKR